MLRHYSERMRFVITGPGRGIGRAVAARLRSDGHQVFGILRPGGSAMIESELDGQVAVDLTEPDAIVTALTGFATDIGPVDGLVHSAGVVLGGDHIGTAAADYTTQFAVNVTAVAMITQVFLPGLRSAAGTVLLLNSGSGLVARSPLGAYGASKFALRSYADSLRIEEPGLRVSSIYPGRVATDMQRDVRRLEGEDYHEDDYLSADTVAALVVRMLTLPTDGVITDLTVRPWSRP